MTETKEVSRRWSGLRKVLERSGPFCHPEFEPSSEVLETIQKVRVLLIGAGGLGCELLKDLALMGFQNIDVIDMDTIELSNLNRQFLFRPKDIGASKAECAARFINQRVPGCKVTPHFCKIQDYDEDFYSKFNVVVCGLDSIVARRWMNGMLLSLLVYDEDNEVEVSSIIPVVDGGTEGFKGNARVMLPGFSACIECTLDLYPPQVTYPLCTIASTPRLPEHCIEYVKVIQWPKDNPFNCAIDGDDPQHINWICEKATERANQFNIKGLNYRLVQGVVKNIIPAVASTNAVLAAACATEVFKLASECCLPLNNFMVFNDADGIYTYTYAAERNDDCLACSGRTLSLTLNESPNKLKLENVVNILRDSPKYQMKSPGVTCMSADGKNRTLYMSSVASIEEKTRDNLKKTLSELNLGDGSEIIVNDVTTPKAVTFKLKFNSMDE